jgi:hypothetical protein
LVYLYEKSLAEIEGCLRIVHPLEIASDNLIGDVVNYIAQYMKAKKVRKIF